MKKNKIKISSNFIADYSSILKKELICFGVKFKMNTPDDIINNFLSINSRLIPQMKRKCFFPKDWAIPKKHEEAIESIILKLEKGDRIFPHLSTRILHKNYSDKMFIHYGIFHFHLSLKKYNKNKRFFNRTGDLLFAYLDRETNNIYILGIFNHKTKWLDENLIKIIYENWPDIFSKLVICEVPHSGFEKEEREYLRKNNCNSTIQINDKSFLLNKAISTNGANTLLIVEKHHKIKIIKNIEERIKIDIIPNILKENSIVLKDTQTLKIKMEKIELKENMLHLKICDEDKSIFNLEYKTPLE